MKPRAVRKTKPARQAPRLVLRAGAFTLLGVAVSVLCSGLSGLGVTAASGPGVNPTGSALPAGYVGQSGDGYAEAERAADSQGVAQRQTARPARQRRQDRRAAAPA